MILYSIDIPDNPGLVCNLNSDMRDYKANSL